MTTKYTLEDCVVRDCLEAVSQTSERIPDLELMLVGGIANQMYCPEKELYRPTNDIDIAPSRIVSHQEFGQGLAPMITDYISSKGRSAQASKTRYSFELDLSLDEPLFIHISRYSKPFFERAKQQKLREIEHSRLLQIPYSDKSIKVVGPEDLIVSKIKRLKRLEHAIDFAMNQRIAYDSLKDRDFGFLAKQDHAGWLGALLRDKNYLTQIITKERFGEYTHHINRYKVEKDLYDISLLLKGVVSETVPFDEDYYDAALADTGHFDYSE